jgi:hypothetical protein
MSKRNVFLLEVAGLLPGGLRVDAATTIGEIADICRTPSASIVSLLKDTFEVYEWTQSMPDMDDSTTLADVFDMSAKYNKDDDDDDNDDFASEY